MLDIGSIHRKEYEINAGLMTKEPRSAGVRDSRASKTGKPEQNTTAEKIIIARAPGRIQFLGEHNDPGPGLYLTAAIDRQIKVAVSGRKDNSLRFYAADLGERKRTTLVNLKYRREDRWANFIKVAIYIFAQLGFPVKGLNFTVTGDIPQQIGLASSSAIETASAVALRGFFRAKINDMDLAWRLAGTHSLFFGKKPEPADYITGLFARSNQFLLIDESVPAVKSFQSPFARCKFLLMDSRVPRLGIESELETRTEELQTAMDILAKNRIGSGFREIPSAYLEESAGNLPEDIRRRSLHVVQEIRRVLDAWDCLLRADIQGFSRLIFNSHESLRNLFEVSCPEIDWMVKRAQETQGVLGARLTGQGFGGCTYTIVKNEAAQEYRLRVEDYERIFGFKPVIIDVKLATGAKVVPS